MQIVFLDLPFHQTKRNRVWALLIPKRAPTLNRMSGSTLRKIQHPRDRRPSPGRMNSEIRSSQLSSRCSGKRRCCHDLREVAPLSRVGGICAALTAPRELQRSMYELHNASMHQWFALAGVAGVCHHVGARARNKCGFLPCRRINISGVNDDEHPALLNARGGACGHHSEHIGPTG